jgi:hypothetical protein
LYAFARGCIEKTKGETPMYVLQYNQKIYIHQIFFDGSFLSMGKFQGEPGYFFRIRHKKKSDPGYSGLGVDEEFQVMGCLTDGTTGVPTFRDAAPIHYGDPVFLYSPKHSVYLLPGAKALEWARLPKFSNNTITFVDANEPNPACALKDLQNKGEVLINQMWTEHDCPVAIRKYPPPADGDDFEYLTYDNTDDGLLIDNHNIKAYERWLIHDRNAWG